jgi:hypothetical protein
MLRNRTEAILTRAFFSPQHHHHIDHCHVIILTLTTLLRLWQRDFDHWLWGLGSETIAQEAATHPDHHHLTIIIIIITIFLPILITLFLRVLQRDFDHWLLGLGSETIAQEAATRFHEHTTKVGGGDGSDDDA